MTDTSNLGLPLVAAAQAQKHVTVNEALLLLDTLAQLAVEGQEDEPPTTPGEGARYLVGSAPTGAFAAHAAQVASFQAGVWVFIPPRAGWIAFDRSLGAVVVFDGMAWANVSVSISELQNLSSLGIGTTADTANPLAAKLNDALFTARYAAEAGSGDLRIKLNKESAARTVSQLYQSNYSGRAETGLAGSDDFRIKVSPDGSAWTDAIVVDRHTGVVDATIRIDDDFGLGASTLQDAVEELYFRLLAPQLDFSFARNSGHLSALGIV